MKRPNGVHFRYATVLTEIGSIQALFGSCCCYVEMPNIICDGASVIERYGRYGFILRHLAAFVLLHCRFIANGFKKCGNAKHSVF